MIRKAELKDIERITYLLRQVLSVHSEGRPDIFIKGTTKYTPAEFSEIISDPETPVFVYEDEDGVVQGHAFCRFEYLSGENCMHDMKSLYIDDICVDEAHRHRGIGAGLYDYIRNFAAENGCYHITLNVWECNPDAFRFYRALGLKPMRTTMEDIL